MPAELTTRCLTFRDIFVCAPTSLFMAFADTGRPTDTSIQSRGAPPAESSLRGDPVIDPLHADVELDVLFCTIRGSTNLTVP